MPKVSVIIPCYNLGSYIDEAVRSVKNQTLKDFEVIIINDGSTDAYTLNKLAAYGGSEIKVIHTENNGLAAARNRGIREARGEYLQFLDADDVIDKQKFELQLELLKDSTTNSLSYCDYFASIENDLTIPCHSRYTSPEFNSKKYVRELIIRWERNLSIPCHCFLFNKSLFTENNIFFSETLPNHEDWECWMNIFSFHPEVFYVNKKLATYRIRSKGMSYNSNLMNKGFKKAILIQKKRQKKSGEEYALLSSRYNHLSYGISSRYKSVALSMAIYKKTIGKLKKLVSPKY